MLVSASSWYANLFLLQFHNLLVALSILVSQLMSSLALHLAAQRYYITNSHTPWLDEQGFTCHPHVGMLKN